jgi:hypothetical protein
VLEGHRRRDIKPLDYFCVILQFRYLFIARVQVAQIALVQVSRGNVFGVRKLNGDSPADTRRIDIILGEEIGDIRKNSFADIVEIILQRFYPDIFNPARAVLFHMEQGIVIDLEFTAAEHIGTFREIRIKNAIMVLGDADRQITVFIAFQTIGIQ